MKEHPEAGAIRASLDICHDPNGFTGELETTKHPDLSQKCLQSLKALFFVAHVHYSLLFTTLRGHWIQRMLIIKYHDCNTFVYYYIVHYYSKYV